MNKVVSLDITLKFSRLDKARLVAMCLMQSFFGIKPNKTRLDKIIRRSTKQVVKVGHW